MTSQPVDYSATAYLNFPKAQGACGCRLHGVKRTTQVDTDTDISTAIELRYLWNY